MEFIFVEVGDASKHGQLRKNGWKAASVTKEGRKRTRTKYVEHLLHSYVKDRGLDHPGEITDPKVYQMTWDRAYVVFPEKGDAIYDMYERKKNNSGMKVNNVINVGEEFVYNVGSAANNVELMTNAELAAHKKKMVSAEKAAHKKAVNDLSTAFTSFTAFELNENMSNAPSAAVHSAVPSPFFEKNYSLFTAASKYAPSGNTLAKFQPKNNKTATKWKYSGKKLKTVKARYQPGMSMKSVKNALKNVQTKKSNAKKNKTQKNKRNSNSNSNNNNIMKMLRNNNGSQSN
jgi:hypothetical protein